MTRIISLLNKGETIMEKSEDKLLDDVKKSEKFVLDEVLKIINTFDVSAGKIQNTMAAEQFLMRIEEKIFTALKRSGYPESIKNFIKSFDDVEQNIREVHSAINKTEITSDQIKPFKRMEVENTISKLTESGLAKDFINPIRQSIYRNILTGVNISDVEKFLKNEIITNQNSDGKLLRYVKQVSRDSISQFDGSVQQNISNTLGLNAVMYVGSLMKDSRGQCVKWVTENGGIIMNADIEEEIRWAKGKNFYETAAGKIRTGGMIAETNAQNFSIFRGGYNCRHRSIAVFKKP